MGHNFQILQDYFEEELIKEIKACDVIEVEEGQRLTNFGDDIEAIPIVLEGVIKVFRFDKHGEEIPIYDINQGQSCILFLLTALIPIVNFRQ